MILPDEALDADIAILGKKGRGKTYTAKGIVERLLELKRRVLILDPLSTWWGLRTMANGEDAGYPVAVFGGPKADVQISDKSGRQLAGLIADRNLPAIIDMGDMRKAEWQRLTGDLLDELFTKNRDPLTIVLEEADVFAPQQPMKDQSTRVLGEVDRIARRGRAFGFRLISITQRPAKLNKDVLTQLSVLIALGVTSPQDRDAIKAWVDGNADRDQAKEVENSLAKLKVGEGWVWAPDLDLLKRTKFPPIRTLDTSATPKAGEKRIEPKTLADVDATALKALLEEPEPEQPKAAAPSKQMIDAAEQSGYSRGLAESKKTVNALQAKVVELKSIIEKALAQSRALEHTLDADFQEVDVSVPCPAPAATVRSPNNPSATAQSPQGMTSSISPSAQKILAAIHSSAPVSLSFAAAATRAGISKRSSAYRGYRKEVEGSDEIEILSDGRYRSLREDLSASPFNPAETVAQFKQKLPPSYANMLQVIADQHGVPLDRETIADMAGISRTSSGLNAGLKELQSLALIERTGDGFALTQDLVI